MTIEQALDAVSKAIKTPQEREYFMIHVARYRKVLTTVEGMARRPQRPMRILDVGCYPYHLPRAIELMGHEVYGISSTHEPIKHKNVKVLNIENEHFPWKDNFFDLVIFAEVLEHLPQSPLLALSEMRRVTKTGGFLLVTTPNIARSINRGKLILGKNIMYPVEDLLENDGKGSTIYMRHNREYTMGELKKIVERACPEASRGGWIVDKEEYFVSYTPFRARMQPDPAWLWLGKFANYLLMLAFPTLRDTLLIIGQK